MAEETDAGGQSAQATYPGSGKFGPEPQLPLASKAAVFPLGSERLILGPPKLIKPWPMVQQDNHKKQTAALSGKWN